MVKRSQAFENGCLYRLKKENGTLWVDLNPIWLTYLQENYDILSSFAYWGLTNFLQVRNPNVPNIPSKLIKKEERNSLSAQRKFWDTAICSGLEVRCPYTDRLLDDVNTTLTTLSLGVLFLMICFGISCLLIQVLIVQRAINYRI